MAPPCTRGSIAKHSHSLKESSICFAIKTGYGVRPFPSKETGESLAFASVSDFMRFCGGKNKQQQQRTPLKTRFASYAVSGEGMFLVLVRAAGTPSWIFWPPSLAVEALSTKDTHHFGPLRILVGHLCDWSGSLSKVQGLTVLSEHYWESWGRVWNAKQTWCLCEKDVRKRSIAHLLAGQENCLGGMCEMGSDSWAQCASGVSCL